jgi:hypothetical protein
MRPGVIFDMSLEQKLAAIRSQLDDLNRIPSLRRQIVDVMLECLEANKDALDDWRKMHFSNAIGSLALNIRSLQQPTNSWLRLCLADLGKVCLPLTERDPHYRSTDPSLRDVTYEQLLGALDSVGRELG